MTGRGGLGELPALTFGYVPSLPSEKRLAEGTEGWRLNDRGVSVVDGHQEALKSDQTCRSSEKFAMAAQTA